MPRTNSFLLLASTSLSEGRDLMAKASDISHIATPIVYVAIKLRNKSKKKSVPPAEGGEGSKKL
jgi:hypothetical protein